MLYMHRLCRVRQIFLLTEINFTHPRARMLSQVSSANMAGRPRANRFQIVPVNEVMNNAQILQETWRLVTLSRELGDTGAAMQWLARRRLIRNSLLCGNCNAPCQLQNRSTIHDGKHWACEPCRYYKSIRGHSFFERSHLSFHDIMLLVYCWSNDYPQDTTLREVNIGSRRIVIDWFNFCREECDNYLVRTPVEIGGFDDTGQPVIVEVDESKYFHRKYHRGRWSEGHWVFGAIERGSGKCVIHLVHDRTAQTLEPLILQHVLPGSHIVSDGWRAYHNLSRLQNGIYQHSIVVHERHFVDPVYPEVHTNNIENLWMRAKRKLRRQFGTYRQLFPSYLREFEYRSLVNDDDIFSHYLTVLAENYA